ncbi:SMP-30/gluconolactonase/LRE family protein [Streptomyces sp. NPDC059761]|uniref:SMP-30/gluconolactonase/LRE family protein n=1 Tax=Streptomyces sp. NPDC059761 TaxID=3346937 RepID=UPI00365C8EAA
MFRLPRLATTATVAVAAFTLLVPAAASAGEPTLTDPHTVANFTFDAGETPENIALEPDGSANLTLAHARQVVRVDGHGTHRLLAVLPSVPNPNTPGIGSAVVTGIVRAKDGTLYVNYATGTNATGIWRIGPHGGTPVQIAQLPADSLPNGLALDEKLGVFYVADSARGLVWRVPLRGGTATIWAAGSALQPIGDGVGYEAGANGIKLHGDAVWVSNTDHWTLLRIPVRRDGTAGTIETRATGLDGIEDFAFTGKDDTVLAALSTYSTIAHVRPNGTHTIVLTTPDGLSNPTAVALHDKTVYVTNGSYFATPSNPNLLTAHLDNGND